MEVKKFLEKYPDIAAKSGLYAIQNNDFNKAHDYVKVGKSTLFVSRFTGGQGSSYTTSYPTGYQIKYIQTVPEHVSKYGPTQNKSRLASREKSLMEFLDAGGVPRAYTRKSGSKPEWFAPANVEDIYTEGFKKVFDSKKEVSTIWECNQTRCKEKDVRSYGKVRDPELKKYNLRNKSKHNLRSNR